jgi:hypothetical protein
VKTVKHTKIASLIALLASLIATPAESQPRLPTTGDWAGPVPTTCPTTYVVLETETYVYDSDGITWDASSVPTPRDWLVQLPTTPWVSVPSYPVRYPTGRVRRRAAFAIETRTLMATAFPWGSTFFTNVSSPAFFRGVTGDLYLVVGAPSANAPQKRDITIFTDPGMGHPYMQTVQAASSNGGNASYFYVRESYGRSGPYAFQDQVTVSCATREELMWSPPTDPSSIPATIYGSYPYRQGAPWLWRTSIVYTSACGWGCQTVDVPF